ncbi:sigma-70 family RNA polymerase sigma factor [Pseudomonadales bacterium]|nr:sigma-70 family RNA polymerase sigma factor [Pseudomonadales bacterium]
MIKNKDTGENDDTNLSLGANAAGVNMRSAPSLSKQKQTRMHSTYTDKPSIDEWSPLLKIIARDRDRKAFARLFDHFAPKIKSYGMMLKSQHTSAQMAEELVQDVMIKVWLKAHCFDSEKASAGTWIFTIARNCRTDFIRKANRINTSLTADDLWPMAEEEEPFTSLHQRRIEKNIHSAVAQLPAEQADVLKRIYIEGKSHSEVSAATGLPLGTVKSRVRLAVSKLRTLL